MSVPKGRRKSSRFEAPHQYYKLRREVTDLTKRKFGYSDKKFNEMIERYKKSHANSNNLDDVVARYKQDQEAYNTWFIDYEREVVTDLVRQIGKEFTFGNSIYPSQGPAGTDEFIERRLRMDAAIANCYLLKQELQYVIETLPVDINKFERFSEMIDLQIALFKGVRQADNRFLGNKTVDKSRQTTRRRRRESIPDFPKEESQSTQTDIKAPNEIPTYQQVKSDQESKTNESKQESHPQAEIRSPQSNQRVPNTAKMNTTGFYNRPAPQTTPVVIGEIKPVLPGQAPPTQR